ncbi:C39 family peptidase [Hyalangium gracile]|uniref:C39 family peptidase n=1 Tax=Hyalangium gracile TaxID=394092 RepID=UPI001CCA8548|nr:C39 family peptidase [Hyalangium gracile]
MSVTLPPSQFRPLPNSQGTSSAQSQGVQQTPALPELPKPPPLSATVPQSYIDGFEQVTKLQQEWAAKFAAAGAANLAGTPAVAAPELAPASVGGVQGSASAPVDWMDESKPVIQQTKDTDCGAAATAILAESMGTAKEPSKAQLMDALDSRFATDGAGATPRQLTDMLANQGLSVAKGTPFVDAGALEEAMAKGQKVVAMVDSDKILPGEASGEAGRSHWVVIDGKDAQGNFKVKDPGTGSSYSVKLEELIDAVNANRAKTEAGGMLVVEKAQQGEYEGVTAERNAQQGVALGNKPGGGSNSRNTYGRESS